MTALKLSEQQKQQSCGCLFGQVGGGGSCSSHKKYDVRRGWHGVWKLNLISKTRFLLVKFNGAQVYN